MPELFNASGGKPQEAAAILLAGSQYGRLSVLQLKGLGFSGRQIDYRVTSGRWRREYRGVILLGHQTADYRGKTWAAQLAYGATAVISHHAAAALWEILPYAGPVHVTLPHQRSSRPGILTHESKSLTRDQVRIHYGLRVTNPIRTLVDLADHLEIDELERALSEAHRLGYVQRHGLRAPHTPGRKGLTAVLRRGARMTRSQIERRLLRDIRRASDVPTPLTNERIGRFEADLFWPQFGLVVEIDVYATHGDRLSFERDRRKQTDFARRGLLTLRVTEETLPRAVADIRAVISDRSGRLSGQ